MGYGFVWSGPRRPVAFVEYDKNLAEYQKKPAENDKKLEADKKTNEPLDWRDGLVGYKIVAPPAAAPQPLKPEGYSDFPYKLATSAVDHERLLMEIGALSGLLFVGWVVTMEKEMRQNDPK